MTGLRYHTYLESARDGDGRATQRLIDIVDAAQLEGTNLAKEVGK